MDEETLTVWLDTALLMLGGFVLMTVLMMTVINPPAKSAETAGEPSPGNVIVEAQWRDNLDADVDLWVEGPGDRPVGYSNKNGRIFNLLRDDLGMAQDMTAANYEIAYSRGMPAGEYVVNVHLYRVVGSMEPVEVRLVASRRTDEAAQAQQLATATVRLLHLNDQVTAFRFDLDDEGSIVPGSMSTLYKELREAAP
jgi:hypothetical protein